MTAFLETYQDLLSIQHAIDLSSAGITLGQVPDHFQIVTGREAPAAVRHKTSSTLAAAFFRYPYTIFGTTAGDFYFNLQLAFRLEEADAGIFQLSVFDFVKVGSLGVKIGPGSDDDTSDPRTFTCQPSIAIDSSELVFTSLALNTRPLVKGTWYILEYAGFIDASGNYSFKIYRQFDGTQVASFSASGIDTRSPGTLTPSELRITTIPGVTIDDLRFATTAADNALETPSVIFSPGLNGDGALSEWTKSNGANNHYEHVDDSGVSEDGDILTSAVPTKDNLFAMPSLGASVLSGSTIPWVGVTAYVSGSDSRAVQALHRSSLATVSVLGATSITVPVSQDDLRWAAKTNPDGGGAWTKTEIDSGQFGLRLVS